MIFVINGLKYDTDKMSLISKKCSWSYEVSFFGTPLRSKAKKTNLYKSNKGNWMIAYTKDETGIWYAQALDEDIAKGLLMNGDLDAYEKLFGQLEEA